MTKKLGEKRGKQTNIELTALIRENKGSKSQIFQVCLSSEFMAYHRFPIVAGQFCLLPVKILENMCFRLQ